MKSKNIIIGLGLLVTWGILLGSCTKEKDNVATNTPPKTIVPIGEEYFDVRELFTEVAPSFDSVMIKMGIRQAGAHQENSIPFYYADLIPQKMVGTYIMDQTMLVNSNAENIIFPVSMPDVTMIFTSQHNSIATLEFTESSITQTIDSVFVMGDDGFNGFSAYFMEKMEFDQPYNGETYHVKIRRGIIMCGSVTPDGLSGFGGLGFRFASIIMDWEDDSKGVIPKYTPGTYMIYEEGDGLAARING